MTYRTYMFYRTYTTNMTNKIIFIILLCIFSFSIVSAASIDYEYPWQDETTPAGLVNRVYIYALGAVGVIAFGVIVYGGILYTVSAGNASKQQDAMAWITGAAWGLVLLLGAYLILYTINPDLVKLRNPAMEPIHLLPPTQTQYTPPAPLQVRYNMFL